MSEKIGKTFDLFLLNRVLTYVKPYFKIFYGTAFCAILIAFLSPTRPLLIQYAFDNYIITPNENKLLLITCFLVFICRLRAFLIKKSRLFLEESLQDFVECKRHP